MPVEAAAPIFRRVKRADADALATLKLATFRATFVEGFCIAYPPDELARFEAETYSTARVSEEIADTTHASWVAQDAQGVLLAYAHAGPAKLPHPDVTPRSGELYQLYVRAGAQGLGLGRRLLNLSLDWLAEAYPGPQWLGVWSGNLKAQAFYAAAGFRKAGDYHFMVGSHHDEEYIFRRG